MAASVLQPIRLFQGAGVTAKMGGARAVKANFSRRRTSAPFRAGGVTANAHMTSPTDLRQRIGVETSSQLRTNIFALLGDSSFFDDGKMRNGTGI
jgi:hypothetical protein